MRTMNIQQTVLEFPVKASGVIAIVEFLLLCAKIMQVIPSTIHIDMFPSNDTHPIGFTATISFLESYAAFDFWPEEEYCHLNLVSCKRFPEEDIISLIALMFHIKPTEITQFDVFKRSHPVDPHGT